MKDFHPQSEEGNYYVAIIQNLFFATLNQEIGNRQFVGKWDPNHHGIKTLYRNRRLFMDNMGEKDIIDIFATNHQNCFTFCLNVTQKAQKTQKCFALQNGCHKDFIKIKECKNRK